MEDCPLTLIETVLYGFELKGAFSHECLDKFTFRHNPFVRIREKKEHLREDVLRSTRDRVQVVDVKRELKKYRKTTGATKRRENKKD